MLGMDRPFIARMAKDRLLGEEASLARPARTDLSVAAPCRTSGEAVVVRWHSRLHAFKRQCTDLDGCVVPALRAEDQIGSFPAANIAADEASTTDLQSNASESRSRSVVVRTPDRLLLERRQALITAAVTGELDIPGMAA